jgi:phosphoglycerate dehydrogenase-like enzyme
MVKYHALFHKEVSMRLKVDIGFTNDYIKNRIKILEFKFPVQVVDQTHVGLEGVDYLLAPSLSKENLECASDLKAVFVPFTGTNRFPKDDLSLRGISLYNSHAKAHIVAERALALTLAVMGKINAYDRALRDQGRWLTREAWGQELWHSLYNKKCAIIGMGAIGQKLVPLLKAFNCRILNLERDKVKELGDIYYDDLNVLLAEADLVYLACSLTDETTHLINQDNLHLLQDTFLINIARGPVVEEEALYKGLGQGILLGAGIDVWYQYPKEGNNQQPSSYDLGAFNHLVMSPHASCHTHEDQHAYYEDIFNQIEQVMKKAIE